MSTLTDFPAGDIPIDQVDVPAGISITRRGCGQWSSGPSRDRGSQLVPNDPEQPYGYRIGASGGARSRAVANGITLTDFSFRNFKHRALILSGYNQPVLDRVGFGRCGTGLYVGPDGADEPRRMTRLTYQNGCIVECDVGVYVSYPEDDTSACDVFSGLAIIRGKIGMEFERPASGTRVTDVYAEAQFDAGIIQHTGSVLYQCGYLETDRRSVQVIGSDGKPKTITILVPSLAIHDGLAVLRHMHYVAWLYIGPTATIDYDDYSKNRIGYVVFAPGDPRIVEWKATWPVKAGARGRIHVASAPWGVGNNVTISRA